MNNETFEFNNQLALDVLLNGLTEVTRDYVNRFDTTYLSEVIIPEGVKSIGDEAFYECDRLTSITIPDSVTSIGKMAFARCNNIVDVTIPDSVKIGWFAFLGCYRAKNYPWGIPSENINVQVS